MEETFGKLVGHVKAGAHAVVGWVDGLPLVGGHVKYAAYAWSAYSVGHYVLGWW